MNADQLLSLYERVAEAPDAIARLRRFVRELAVRGKLIEQDKSDEPVSVVLRRVKVSAVPTGAFALPCAWAWVTVGSVAESRLGKMLDQAKNKGVPRPYLRNINVRWFDFDLSNLLEMPFEDGELPEFALRAGDVLICEGGEPGRAAVWDERAKGIYFQKAIHRVRFAPIVDPAYFVTALRASAEDGRLAKSFTGTGIKHFTGKGLGDYSFPLPPLAEQRRIVAKVDELMALCDQLVAARTAREATRDRLTTASLTRLTTPDTDAKTFRSHARFALDALPALTTRPDQIKTLRQAILNLAVRGKLVPHDAGDEPASKLLRRIIEKAPADIGRRARNRDTPISNALEEVPFELPKGWTFAPLGQLVRVLNGRAYKQQELLSEGTPVLRVGNLFTSSHWYYSNLELDEDKYCDAGDLIYAWSASFGPFIWEGPRVIFHYHIWKLPLISEDDLDKRYLYNFLFQKTREIKEEGHGISMVHMTKEKMEKLVVPLPPLAEQHRIVTKIDELMALCDRLEASLTATNTRRRRLLEALLHEALEPAAQGGY